MLKFALLGAGRIAHRFAEAVSLVKDAEIVAVASKSMERASSFAVKYAIPRAYDSYDAMLADREVEAVYIATTHNFHKENILACLAAGKHVLCEKPMVLTENDARECFAEARARNLFLMEAMWSRCLPAFQKAQKWIASGKIGEIRSVSAVIGYRTQSDATGRIYNPDLAGGALYDIGVYPLEIVSGLINEPVQDVLFKRRNHATTGVDANVSMIVSYPSCDACIQCMVNCAPKEYTIINGTMGTVEIPASFDVRTARLYDSARNLIEQFDAPYRNGFVAEVEETVRCIANGQITSGINPPVMTIECARIFETVLQGKTFEP